ncbi:hypothetical protein [Gracilibacillus thailandensis]|nr:hypothetical protein [Gracilibacillus thailandensis]
MNITSEENVLHVLEIIESRLKKASIIFCSQFSPECLWHTKNVAIGI